MQLSYSCSELCRFLSLFNSKISSPAVSFPASQIPIKMSGSGTLSSSRISLPWIPHCGVSNSPLPPRNASGLCSPFCGSILRPCPASPSAWGSNALTFVAATLSVALASLMPAVLLAETRAVLPLVYGPLPMSSTPSSSWCSRSPRKIGVSPDAGNNAETACTSSFVACHQWNAALFVQLVRTSLLFLPYA